MRFVVQKEVCNVLDVHSMVQRRVALALVASCNVEANALPVQTQLAG